jgi:hypothetical protein
MKFVNSNGDVVVCGQYCSHFIYKYKYIHMLNYSKLSSHFLIVITFDLLMEKVEQSGNVTDGIAPVIYVDVIRTSMLSRPQLLSNTITLIFVRRV